MATILCQWLNDDFQLSRSVEPESVEDSFKSGYLLAELLNQLGIIEDLKHYQNSNHLDASIHNYSLLEPILRDVGLPLTSSMAFDLITAKKGVAFKLLYNLRVQLSNQRNAAASKATNFDAAFLMNQHSLYTDNKKKFYENEHQYFVEHLRLKLAKNHLPKKKTVVDEYIERLEGRPRNHQKSERKPVLELPEIETDKNKPAIETDEQLLIRQLPAPHNPSHLAEAQAKIMKMKMEARRNEAEVKLLSTLKDFTHDATQFERKMKLDREESMLEIKMSNRQMTPASVRLSSASTQLSSRLTTPSYSEKNAKYLEKIRAKREEEEWLRHERTQRRSRLLQVHAKINQDFEKNQYEKILVEKLSKQSKQERRIAEQLLVAKQEKEVMRQNRQHLENKYAQQRQIEYENAMDRESKLAKTLREEYHGQLAQFQDSYQELIAQYEAKKKSQEKAACQKIAESIVDVALKVAVVKEMNDSNVPAKTEMELKTLFKGGAAVENVNVPLDQDKLGYHRLEFPENSSQAVQQESAELLDYTELKDYLNMENSWKMDFNLKHNVQLGKMVDVLFKMIEEAEKISPTLKLSPEPIKVVLLGKRFAGKRSLAKLVAKACSLVTVDSDSIVSDALQAYKQSQTGSRPADDPKAQLGAKISEQTLKDGTIDDNTINELFCLTISELERDPAKPGWVLIDFPKTKVQAQMLDKALSGYDELKQAKPGTLKKAAKEPPKSAGAKRQSLLAPGSDKSNGAENAFSVIDAVIHLELSNELAFKRCSGRRIDPMDGKMYHIDFNPPPSTPGLAERLVPVEDPVSVQLHQHLASFEQNYDSLKTWYEKFGNFFVLNSSQSPNAVAKEAESLLQNIIEKKRKEREEEVIPEGEKKEETGQQPAEPTPVPVNPGMQRNTLPSGAKTPTKHFAQLLHDKWVDVETHYSDAMRFAFRSLRREREGTLDQFYQNTMNIKKLLKLSDGRQNLISNFREEYNAQDEDNLLDPDVKAEFHARADELRDKLWDKIDTRREEVETERLNYIDSRFVEDRAVISTNVFISMMQLELERYAATKQFICDFARDSIDQMVEPVAKPVVPVPKLENDSAIPAFFEDLKKLKKDLFARKRRGSNSNLKKSTVKKGAEDAQAKQAEFTLDGSVFSQALDAAISAIEKQMTDDDLKDLKKQEATLPDSDKMVLSEATEALVSENTLMRSRMAQIKRCAMEHLGELVQKGRDVFTQMFETIGAKYQMDIDAVKLLVLFIKDRVEAELKLEDIQFDANKFWIPEEDYANIINGLASNSNN